MSKLLQGLLVASAVVLAAMAPLLSTTGDPLQNPLPPILRESTCKIIMFLMHQVHLLSNDEKLASVVVGISSCGISHMGTTPSHPPPSALLQIP